MLTHASAVSSSRKKKQPSLAKISPVIFLGILVLLLQSQLICQEKEYFFYNPEEVGSEALYNPLSVIANAGFDSFQIIEDRLPTWKEVYWSRSTTNVWRSATSPLPIINRFGWSRFLRQEIFPISFNINDAQYAPNYALHLIGGGMTFRKLSEWYDYNGFPVPVLWGAVTRMTYEFINESVENGPGTYLNEDCLPDMLVFQPLGMILFSFDDVSEFFSSTLNLNDWSQPVILTFAPFAVRNAGQNFVMKLALNQGHSTNLFFHFGDFAIVGLSLKTNSEDAISFGGGLASIGVKDLPFQNEVHSNTVVPGGMAGIYYDRNNSLLASTVYSADQHCRLRLNLYPGLLPGSAFSPGLFVTFDSRGGIVAGLTTGVLPIGLGFYHPQ